MHSIKKHLSLRTGVIKSIYGMLAPFSLPPTSLPLFATKLDRGHYIHSCSHTHMFHSAHRICQFLIMFISSWLISDIHVLKYHTDLTMARYHLVASAILLCLVEQVLASAQGCKKLAQDSYQR